MTISEIEHLFSETGLSQYWSTFKPLIKSCIRIFPEKVDQEDQLPIGQSKIGGLPDLPKKVEWFEWQNKSLSFIAQINCSEVKEYDLEGLLPATGILYFFYDSEQRTWGFDPKDKGSFKVFYYDGAWEQLERKSLPDDLDYRAVFKTCKLSYKVQYNLLDLGWNTTSELFSEEELSKYWELVEKLSEDSTINKLLGHSDNIQNPMELECQLVTNGLYCGDSSGFNDPQAEELSKHSREWQLLLQIDSNEEEAGMMWGDVGRIYYWIKETDLRQRQFDNVWMILQCY